ncbi:protein POF1B [Scleropages formosus]|uniref:POF1B actin binding protein n=1 Tax=Scleropages formosus TaxID=113540 RepID=A0A8C9REY2_SCLFO|nr:protein POF1B [Scleropages formosus]
MSTMQFTRNYSSASASSDLATPSPVSPSLSYVSAELPGSTAASFRAVNVSTLPVSQVRYVSNGPAVDGNVMYGTLRYLVPVDQRNVHESYVLVNGAVANKAVSPVYVQKVAGLSLAGVSESAHAVQYTASEQQEVAGERSPSVCSQSSVKSPTSVSKETEVLLEQSSITQTNNVPEYVVQQEVSKVEPQEKLDTRFFGELLAEVYRKTCDIHTHISEHVAKIRGRKHLLDPTIDYKVEKEETEALIPKGMSELTKQQIRYLLQTRLTADKTMRLLLTTFSSLREELGHLQNDLERLQSEKEELEKDLSFRADQALKYDRMLEALRENNRQLQVSLKECTLVRSNLETQLLDSRSMKSGHDYRIKELDGSLKTLEQENKLLRQKLAGQGSSSSFQVKTEELSKQYNESLNSMRDQKDNEIQSLRAQLIKMKTEYSTQTMSDSSLELRITELLAKLEQQESTVKRQEEEIKWLKQERNDKSTNVTRTVITKRYMNQYPILGLLGDDYQTTSPVKEAKTIVVQSTEQAYK